MCKIKTFPDILNVISAARLWKNLPLLFIFLSGSVIGGGGDGLYLLIGVVGIAFSSAFMTHLNIITDRELDLIDKPHLYKMLSSNKQVMNSALFIEILITLFVVFFFLINAYFISGLMILLFTVVAILYSYNFFSKTPQNKRLKVHWLGHFIILIIGYVSLWAAGFFINGSLNDFYQWLPVFIGISLSEYALFLFESSIDQNAEKKQKLKTLSAMLGREKTTYISIAMALLSLLIILSTLYRGRNTQLISISFLPITILILFFLSVVSYKRLYLKSQTYKVPDLIFNFGRVYILLTATYIIFIQ